MTLPLQLELKLSTQGGLLAKNWDAVAAAVRGRLGELDMTQAELVTRARVAPMTVRDLLQGKPRRRQPRTLEAISLALRWPPQHLLTVLEGDRSNAASDGLADSDVAQLREEVADLRMRVAALEAERKH